MGKGLFVTGTGTDVGKTYVTGLLVKKLAENNINALYYKAAMSGNNKDENGKIIPGDALFVKNTAQITQELDTMCPYVYENAVSPHLASRFEGNPVKLETVNECFYKIDEKDAYITMEGSGGILCPLCFDEAKLILPDIIKALHLPCILVADAGLGTINDVVLTWNYMRIENIPLKAIIFNHYHPGNIMEEDNIRMCEYMTKLKVIACVSDGDTEINIDINELKQLYEEV